MITVDITLVLQIIILLLIVFSVPIIFTRFRLSKYNSSTEVEISRIYKPGRNTLKNIYFNLRGRLTLKEYWLFWNIPFFLITFIFLMLESKWVEANPIVMSTINLLLLWPLLATTVKRLHDLNKSGWWFLLNLLPLIGWLILSIFLWFVPGTKETNDYG